MKATWAVKIQYELDQKSSSSNWISKFDFFLKLSGDQLGGLGFPSILHQNLLYPIILFFSTAFFYFSSNHWQFDMLFWKWYDRINVRATFEKCRSNSNWSWTYLSHIWRSVYGHYTYSRLCKSFLHLKQFCISSHKALPWIILAF